MISDLEHKLRLLRNTVSLQKSAAVFLKRNEKGVVYDFEVINSETICKLFTQIGSTPDPPSPAYQQVIKGQPTVDFTADELLLIEHLQPGEIYPGVKSPFCKEESEA